MENRKIVTLVLAAVLGFGLGYVRVHLGPGQFSAEESEIRRQLAGPEADIPPAEKDVLRDRLRALASQRSTLDAPLHGVRIALLLILIQILAWRGASSFTAILAGALVMPWPVGHSASGGDAFRLATFLGDMCTGAVIGWVAWLAGSKELTAGRSEFIPSISADMEAASTAGNLLARVERWMLRILVEDSARPRSHFALFVLMSVLIDNLANFRYRGEISDDVEGSVGERYRKFICTYMPKYAPHAQLMYSGFRSRLVHGFQIKGVDIQQEESSRPLHLQVLKSGNLCLHSKELLGDLLAAFDKLRRELIGPDANPGVIAAFEAGKFKRWVHTDPSA